MAIQYNRHYEGIQKTTPVSSKYFINYNIFQDFF